MKLFFAYLYMHRKSIALFFCFFIILYAIAFLYAVPPEAVHYAFILCFVLGCIVGIVDFIKFRKKHNDLEFIADNIDYALTTLPEAANIAEEDYMALIETLNNARMHEKTANDMKISDINEYYTLWVHQIKTPIAAMRLLLDNEKNDELSEQLFRIEQYVDMVLTYIRCGDDTSDYMIRRCSLDEIIKSSVRKFSKSFIRKKISMDFTPTEMQVLTDEKWLTFVIEQLLSNALKYTKSGCISVYAENKKYLVIKDTGIGIAAEDLPRITQKGYTGYNGRQDKKSTGLGLFLCGKILSSLGHTLKITSEIGQGTTVRIGFNNPDIRFE